ncbi:CHAT domain-containing protein [Amycolatopsis sacchari]|uniref:CHAT domain-containing protein n=1 Tax=Amycolatopsis sacchari TaxID=115433 RepID=UPI003EBA0E33
MSDRVREEALADYWRAADAGYAADYAAAVPLLRHAVAVTPLEHPRGVECRLALATALTAAFSGNAAVEALDEAVTALTEVARALPRGDPDRKVALVNLSGALNRRFGYLGEPADLRRTVDVLREALTGEPYDSVLLGNLCAALENRYRHTMDPADLDEAIDAGERAVEFCPPGAGHYAHVVHNLGLALVQRYRLHGTVADLDEGITLLRRAAELLPPDVAERIPALNALARACRDRFEKSGDPADLDEAIDIGRFLLRNTGELPYLAADVAAGLGICLHLRAESTGSESDSAEAVAVLRAARDGTGPIRMRLLAATLAALYQSGRGPLADALEDYAAAVDLLPLLVWRGLDRERHEQLLREYAGLPSEVAAAAIAAGQPERAVELLEQSRGVLWSQLFETRTDIAALADAHPGLADRLDALRTRLDPPSPDPDERRRLAREWDELLATVRDLDGFGNFLRPAPFRELRQATVDGPVVLVNANRFRCDALIATSDGVTVLPLPGLDATAAGQWTYRCLEAVSEPVRGGPARQAVLACLEWLWDAVGGPVTEFLGCRPGGRTRIWWSATGPLSALPLHAAGYHDPDDGRPGDSVLERAVSSYTPSLRSLIHARRPEDGTAPPRLLVTAVPDAPGADPLPGAAEEAARLAALHPGTVLTGPAATRTAVVRELPAHPYVHFACHGDQDLSAPSGNALHLYDGPLRLADLVALDLRDAQVAVLSACRTALGGAGLFDEAIHLGAAFQLIGYRDVVATLWPVHDLTAPEVAAAVWRDPRHPAEAVHEAVLALRDRYWHDPVAWAAFAHLGR